MPTEVADRSSNRIENIEYAVEILGRSKVRHDVFKAVYTGKKTIKTVDEIADTIGRSRQQVLNEGKNLADNGLVRQTSKEGITAYEKLRFFQTNRDEILRYVEKPEKLIRKPTKRRPSLGRAKIVTVPAAIPRKKIKAEHITVDDIDSFKDVRGISFTGPVIRMKEEDFKRGLLTVLGESGEFKDWGGELSDLYSTRLTINRKRRPTALALKGSGTSGKLTPAKMGKNGDQIQRLLLCPAEVFIIQYCGQVEQSVHELLENLTRLKSFYEDRELYYGIIDGQDSSRLIKAYKNKFGWGSN